MDGVVGEVFCIYLKINKKNLLTRFAERDGICELFTTV